jgi:hypothetical protein
MSEPRGWRRVLWVVSLVLVLGAITLLFFHYGIEWGIGGAP